MSGGTLAGMGFGADPAPFAARHRGLDAHEIAVVLAKRELRASWDACARMVGRPVHDVRLACDADYRLEHAPPSPATDEAATPPVKSARGGGWTAPVRMAEPGQVEPFSIQCAVLLAIAAGCGRGTEIGRRVGRDVGQIGGLTRALYVKALVERTLDQQWAVTRAGHVEIARVRGFAQALGREAELIAPPPRKTGARPR